LSYDLDIATRVKPEQVHLEVFAALHKGLALEGRLGDDLTNVTVHKRALFSRKPLVEVYTPTQAHEPEDFDEDLAKLVPPPCWLTQIAIPGFVKEGIELGIELAEHIADKCDGAVFDPQAGTVIWPKEKGSPTAPPSEKARIREVELEWYIASSRSGVEAARALLMALRKHCPEAVPIRFGEYEPLQGRMESRSDEPFFKAWEKAGRDTLGMLFFKAKNPCFGGTIDLPGTMPPRAGGTKAGCISLNFDGTTLYADSQTRETVSTLFLEVARALHAFYGRGFVRRDVIVSRGGPAYDGKSETYPSGLWRGAWRGVPPVPTWLTWFGPPYNVLVEESLPPDRSVTLPEGVLVRLGQEPLDLDQLQSLFPALPSRLLSGVQEQVITLPTGRIVKVSPDVKAAEFIPPLE